VSSTHTCASLMSTLPFRYKVGKKTHMRLLLVEVPIKLVSARSMLGLAYVHCSYSLKDPPENERRSTEIYKAKVEIQNDFPFKVGIVGAVKHHFASAYILLCHWWSASNTNRSNMTLLCFSCRHFLDHFPRTRFISGVLCVPLCD